MTPEERAAYIRVRNAELGLHHTTRFLIKCATADKPDARESLNETLADIAACLDELAAAQAVTTAIARA